MSNHEMGVGLGVTTGPDITNSDCPFPVFNKFVGKTQISKRADVVNSLSQLDHCENAADLATTLDNIFLVDSSDLIFFKQGGNEEYLGSLLNQLVHNPGILSLLPIMYKEVDKQDRKIWPTPIRDKMALTFLLSQLNYADLPSDLALLFGETEYKQYNVKSSKEGWYLCPNSEDLMEDSIAKDALGPVLVDDVILVKLMNGKTTGMCIYPVATPTGILLPGTWYSPDGQTRNIIEKAYEDGRNTVSLNEGGTWHLMRPLKASNLNLGLSSKQVLKRWQTYAANL
jgi:hypothetical protein